MSTVRLGGNGTISLVLIARNGTSPSPKARGTLRRGWMIRTAGGDQKDGVIGLTLRSKLINACGIGSVASSPSATKPRPVMYQSNECSTRNKLRGPALGELKHSIDSGG